MTMIITPIVLPLLPKPAQCCELSRNGQVFCTDHTVLHMWSNRRADCYILQSQFAKIEASRLAIAQLTGMELTDIRYSYPAMARQVSAWIGEKQPRNVKLRTDIIPVWHYQHCEPCLLPDQIGYDMRSAYWQIASKAKSLLCEILPEKERIIWLKMTKSAEGRWERTKICLEPYKRLRLAIIGVNSVSSSRKSTKPVYFAGGTARQMPGMPPTWFSSLALLTIRVAYELTQLQAKEARTCYANADCVFCDCGQIPQYWQDYGIEYSVKGAGTLDARAIGIWRCGTERTGTYDYFDRNSIECLSVHTGYNYARAVYHERYCQ